MGSVSYDFAGERVVVTGAAGLIGSRLAARFASAGARVVAVDRDGERLAAECGGMSGVTRVAGDVTDEEAVERVLAAADALGGLDVLVNNAGYTHREPFLDLDTPTWRHVLAVNLEPVYLLSVRAARRWRDAGRGGVVVNTSSPGAARAHENASVYDAAKAGVEGLTRAMAVELGRYGIRVNCVCPGGVAAAAEPVGDLPSGHRPTPDDIADAALFLASTAAAQVTGHVLAVDGGLLARLRPPSHT